VKLRINGSAQTKRSNDGFSLGSIDVKVPTSASVYENKASATVHEEHLEPVKPLALEITLVLHRERWNTPDREVALLDDLNFSQQPSEVLPTRRSYCFEVKSSCSSSGPTTFTFSAKPSPALSVAKNKTTTPACWGCLSATHSPGTRP
jgi:hypothetical protein